MPDPAAFFRAPCLELPGMLLAPAIAANGQDLPYAGEAAMMNLQVALTWSKAPLARLWVLHTNVATFTTRLLVAGSERGCGARYLKHTG